MIGHTPFPWQAEGPDPFGDFTIAQTPRAGTPVSSLAIAAVVSNLREPGEVAANARLIAASPDVADAALYVCAEWNNRSGPETMDRAIGYLESALRQAGVLE